MRILIPVEDRVSQIILSHVFKFFENKCPKYISDLFTKVNRAISTRQSYSGLHLPNRKTNLGKNTLSYIGPTMWNGLPTTIMENKVLNTFKHKLKDHYLNQFHQRENNQFIYYQTFVDQWTLSLQAIKIQFLFSYNKFLIYGFFLLLYFNFFNTIKGPQ